jgi:hypothetical protein
VQPHQELGAAPFEPLLQPHRVVAGVEDEQGDDVAFRQPADQNPHLLRCDVVGVFLGTRLASTGATHESRSKESLATSWYAQPATIGWPAECLEGL